MNYPAPLQAARLLRRYKRFLADVEAPGGERFTIHCPNTGSMKHCAEPGDTVWYSTSDKPGRKYPYTWELTTTARGDTIGIHSARANQLVREALEAGRIKPLRGYQNILSEVRYGEEKSRVDLLLRDDGLPDCFVEVKSVTLLETPVSKGVGCFPDAVSERGTKHLRELQTVAAAGNRAVLFYCVQHSGVRVVKPAWHIDPAYCAALVEAMQAGVEVLAYKCRMSPERNVLGRAVRFEPDP